MTSDYIIISERICFHDLPQMPHKPHTPNCEGHAQDLHTGDDTAKFVSHFQVIFKM